MIINLATLRALYVGYKANFQEGLQSRATPDWSKIATLVPSTTRSEDYGWLGQVPRMREWIGDRVVQNISQHGYSITNKSFEVTIGVKRDDIEDDNLGVYAPLFKELGISASEWPDDLVFSLLAAGETTNGYDQVPFFSASHPEGSGVVSNFASGGGTGWYLLDTSRSLRPLIFQQRKAPRLVSRTNETDDNVFERAEYQYGADSRGNAGYGFWQMAFKSELTLDKTNFDAAVQAMMSRKNDKGSSLKIMPTLLVVPPALRAAARDLIEAEKNGAGGTNTNYKAVEILVAPQLA